MSDDSPKPSTAFRNALMLTAALSALSCRTSTTLNSLSERIRTDTLTICRTEHDTIVTSEPDSATLSALFECDSLGNALLAQINQLNGQRTAIAAQLSKNGGRTLLKIVSNVLPEQTVVPISTTTSIRSSRATSDTRTVAQPATRPLKDRLAAVALFLIGLLAGYALRTLRAPP